MVVVVFEVVVVDVVVVAFKVKIYYFEIIIKNDNLLVLVEVVEVVAIIFKSFN